MPFAERDKESGKITGVFAVPQSFETEEIDADHPDLIEFHQSQRPPALTSYVQFWDRLTPAERHLLLKYARRDESGAYEVEGFLRKLQAQPLAFDRDDDVRVARVALLNYKVISAPRISEIFETA